MTFDIHEYHRRVFDYYKPRADVPKEEDRVRVVSEAMGGGIVTSDSSPPPPAEARRNLFHRRFTVDRHGSDELLDWLDQTDFWYAPASTRFHESEAGGLARHSLRVHKELCNLAADLAVRHPDNFPDYAPDILAVVGLLHDVCKVGYYAPAGRWRKDDEGQWYLKTEWTVKDDLPMGHGEKSVFMVVRQMPLTREEAAAIRWHLGPYEPGVVHGYPTQYAHGDARDKWPLVLLLQMADLVAHNIERQEHLAREAQA